MERGVGSIIKFRDVVVIGSKNRHVLFLFSSRSASGKRIKCSRIRTAFITTSIRLSNIILLAKVIGRRPSIAISNIN
jgi:hypothetical protein